MKTPFDFITLAIFAGLIVLFLQRSVSEAEADDHLWQYLVAAVGCAATNYVGNQGYGPAAALLLIATLGFIIYVLRPIKNFPRR